MTRRRLAGLWCSLALSSAAAGQGNGQGALGAILHDEAVHKAVARLVEQLDAGVLAEAVPLPNGAGSDSRIGSSLEATAAGPATMIWAESTRGGQEVWLRRALTVPEGSHSARIVLSCDNECSVFVNGKEVATGLDRWEFLNIIDLDAAPIGETVIAVHAKNLDGPAALALWFLWKDEKGEDHSVTTSAEWRVSETEVRGWEKVGFDASKWAAATEKGVTPWTRVVYGGEPQRIRVVNQLNDQIDVIDAALRDLRAAPDPEAQLRSLDAVERALMRARGVVWARREAILRAKRETPSVR